MSRNLEKRKEYIKKYFLEHKDKIRAIKKKYEQTHKEERKKSKKIYDQIHQEERRKQRKSKYQKNINFRVVSCLRSRLYTALKNKIKLYATLSLIGCSIEQLKQHLASKFQEGMSFENYGKWNIDHIRPCASFDLTKESEQKKCFHYTNLQPLWALDNKIKYSK